MRYSAPLPVLVKGRINSTVTIMAQPVEKFLAELTRECMRLIVQSFL